ncbi:MAG: glycosyltransferase family 39 protein [Thermoflexales bacterium]|nr:glycosyltransferase family 39 protein [Thermoflexales bacterium]
MNKSLRCAQALSMFACALSFGLAMATLDARSLWGDEAFSVWASRQPALALIAGLDAQPPLYHLALGLGRALWGDSEFAVRFLSVLCVTLMVAVAYAIGRRLVAPNAGAALALVVGTSPLLLYFAQEARMYALAALLAALSTWAVALGAPSRSARGAVGYAVASVAALFTHYYTAGPLAANALVSGVTALRARSPRVLLRWAAAHLAIALVFGGWFIGLQSRYAARAVGGRSQLLPPLHEMTANIGAGIEGLVFGMRANGSLREVALGLFVLGLVGAALHLRAGRRAAASLGALGIAFSLLLVTPTASPSGIVPDFSPRYYLFILLPLALAATGWAISRWWIARAGLGLCVALVGLYGTAHLLDPSWQKSRYAALVQHLHAQHKPEDGIVLVNSDQYSLAAYYRLPKLPTWVVPNDRLNDAEFVRNKLHELVRDRARVWVIRFGWATALGAQSTVEQQLRETGVMIDQRGFQDGALVLYDLRVGAAEGQVQPADALFGGRIRLMGVRERRAAYRPGESVTLDLVWRAERQPNADYTVFMHLRRADTGEQIAALDSQPQVPTSRWQPGAVFTDTRAVPIPLDAKPGEYVVIIGWYLYPSFERLSLAGEAGTEFTASRFRVGE